MVTTSGTVRLRRPIGARLTSGWTFQIYLMLGVVVNLALASTVAYFTGRGGGHQQRAPDDQGPPHPRSTLVGAGRGNGKDTEQFASELLAAAQDRGIKVTASGWGGFEE